MLPQPTLSRTKRPIGLDGSAQSLSHMVGSGVSGNTHTREVSEGANCDVQRPHNNGSDHHHHHPNRQQQQTRQQQWDTRRSGIYYAGGLREFGRETAGNSRFAGTMLNSHNRLVLPRHHSKSSSNVSQMGAALADSGKHLAEASQSKPAKHSKTHGLALFASRLLGKGSNSNGNSTHSSSANASDGYQPLPGERSRSHRFRDRTHKLANGFGRGDRPKSADGASDPEITTINHISTPYNIKHDFHIGIDELDEVMQQLPHYFKALINNSDVSQGLPTDSSGAISDDSSPSIPDDQQLGKLDLPGYSGGGVDVDVDVGAEIDLQGSELPAKSVSTPIYEEMTQTKEDSPTRNAHGASPASKDKTVARDGRAYSSGKSTTASSLRDRERRYAGSHTNATMNRSTVHGMALGGGGGTSTDTSCSSNGKGVSSHRRNPSLTSRRKAIRPKKLLSAIRDSGEGLNFAPSSPYTPDTAISAMSVATAGSLVRRSRACSRGPKSPQSASASFGPDSRRQSTEDTNIPGEVQWQSKSKRGLYSNLRASVSTRSLPAMQSVSAATADAGHHSPNRSSGFRDDYCPTASSSECTVGNAASQPLSASTRSFGFVRNNSLKEPARKPKRYSRSSNNTSAATTPATATPKSPVGTLTAKDLSQPQPSLSKQLSKPSVQAPQQSTSTAPAVSTTNTTAAVNATSPLLLSGASQYSDLEQFAEGESGNLYSAYSEKTNSKVAIKKIPTSKLERLKKLRSEVALMEGVSCPEIVAFYDGFKVGDNFWVVYEYMDICALADLLGEYPSLILPEPLIAYAAQRLLRALGYLHQKRILHCDVRSDNILINSKGEVKLADFSNSTRLASGGSIQRSSSGAVYWMAPEIPKGQGYSAKSDVWAAGVVIYEMVMGKPPYIEYPELKAVTLIRDNGLAPWESPPFTPSQQLRDFVAKACDIRIQERFTAPQLLDHPFLTSLVTDNCPKDLLNFVAELESMQDGEEEEEEEEEDEGDDKAMLGQGKE